MKNIYIVIVVLLSFGCQDNLEVDLGSNYFYSYQSKENDCIILKDSIIKGVSDYVVMGVIMDYKYNDDFILVFRNNPYPNVVSTLENKHNIWAQQSGDMFQFWVIEKQKQKVFGPLNVEKYIHLRDSLKIPENIRLEL